MSEEYQRLQDAARDVDREIAELQQNCRVHSAAEVAVVEGRLDELSVKRGSLAKAMILLQSVSDPEFQQQQKEFIRQLPEKYHAHGVRRKVVHLPGGVDVTLHVTYYHRQKDEARASRKPQRGLFPALMLLGISNGLTPTVRRRMAKASALLGSFEEAREMLAEAGITASVNTLRKVCGHIGQKLVQLTSSGSMQVAGNVTGRRIVVSLDGGRVRLREPRRGRTKKGRKKFAANWREPRLFIIYAVDDEGRMASDFAPIIDGTLASCDRLFEMLQAYLVSIHITEASRVLFVADGAALDLAENSQTDQNAPTTGRAGPATDRLLARGGIPRQDRREQTTDRFKTQTLGDDSEKATVAGRDWIGGDELKAFLSGCRTKSQTTWLNYFITHGLTHRRMDYSTSRSHHLPIGSGAVESAIRRVINLRVKSNSMYWLRENAETMIRLRAWLKAGRAEELFQQTTYNTINLAA